MKIPPRLQPLVDEGLVDAVVDRLMSGKEADVFVVRCGGELRCAKVYKDAAKRSFKKAATYAEGRRSRSGRRQRAMERGSRYGRAERESAWQSAEIDALRRLANAGVRVPETYGVLDGVLLMELIMGDDGLEAPRLGEISMDREQALEDHAIMLGYIVTMLCEGLIHGDLSPFNVLVDPEGPVIIDLPQAIDASANNSARAFLIRDVTTINEYYAEFAPELKGLRYGEEIWALYEDGGLHPEVTLTGAFEDPDGPADIDAVLAEIQATLAEEEARRERTAAENEDEEGGEPPPPWLQG
ncbi:MAG: PA4780 family RIO1-like protein kinase [Pseudomonadales bacterium]|jgi:RIO kinase 1|nr:PA4780 family RIO1-like protein kinase [Pseudomonadales bacterium]